MCPGWGRKIEKKSFKILLDSFRISLPELYIYFRTKKIWESRHKVKDKRIKWLIKVRKQFIKSFISVTFYLQVDLSWVKLAISIACSNFTHLALWEAKVLILAVFTYLVVYTSCEKLITVYQWLTKILGSHNFIFTVPWEFNLEACVFPSQGEVWMSLTQSSWTPHLV